MFAMLLEGGPFMFCTLTVSIIVVAIFFWRLYYFFGKSRSRPDLLTEVLSYINSGSFSRAIEICNVHSGPMPRVLKSALLRANRSEKEIRRGVEAMALEEIPKIKAGTVFLPQLSNLATLLGLIGTIHGLIIAFHAAGAESAATRQAMLSKGIAIAFYNTFFGLLVATMGIVFYLVLLGKMNSSMALLEQSVASVVDTILLQQHGQARKSA